MDIEQQIYRNMKHLISLSTTTTKPRKTMRNDEILEYTLPVYYGERKQLQDELNDLVFLLDNGYL
jgi:hypothetical protein